MASEIRVNSIKNRSGLSTVTWNDEGLNVVGVVTAIGLSVSGNGTIEGNLGVAGTLTYEDVTRIDAVGLSTFREGLQIGPLAGIAATVYKDGSIRTTGIITASSFDATGDFSIADKIIHTGDTNTAIRFPAADTFSVETGGSERLRINSSGNVSIGNNPTVAADTLFHVEKSGETNVKFEGNTTTLGARLSLQNNNTAAGALNQIDFNDAGGQSTSTIKGFNTDQTNNYGYLSFCTRNAQGAPPTERMRIDKDGFVTKPYNCGFCAYANGLWEPSGTGDIWVNASFTKQFDTNNDFDTSDNTFTAPVAGRYMFHFGFRHQFTQGGYVWVYLKKNGSSFSNMHVTVPQTSANMWHDAQAIFGIMSLAANDEIRPQISVNYAGVGMRGFQFSGYLLG